MKKIFILTGEPSGDRLASKVISKLQKNDNNIQYLPYGNQIWTVDNAQVTTYKDGTTITQVTDPLEWSSLTTGAWTYYDNDPTKAKLYNWYAMSGNIAPDGWRVATDEDWNNLENYLIQNGFNFDGSESGNNIAKILTAMSSTGILKTIGLSNKNISAMVDGDYELVNLARLGDASIGKRWKLSNVDNNILKFLVEHANSPIDEKILSDMIVDGTPKILLYRWAQMLGKYEIFANHIKSFEAPVFPVNGNDLIQAGFKKGPDLGKKLNLLKLESQVAVQIQKK